MKIRLIKKERFKTALTRNVWAKVTALMIAALLWIGVALAQGTLGKIPGDIPVKAVNLSEGLVAIYDQKSVEIEIMAEAGTWRQLSASSFSANIDLAGIGEGTYELPVNVSTSIQGVQIVRKNPDKIMVSVERVISKEVNINKRVEGSAAEGLVAGNIDLEPEVVEAKGPTSIINTLTEATVVIELNGESADFEKMVEVVAFSDQTNTISNITFSPSQVLAKVSIVKASTNKTVGIKVNTFGAPKEGYYVSKITVVPNTIDITGSASTLQAVDLLETRKIDISDISQTIESEPYLVIPSGIALQRGEPSRVKVIINLSSGSISRNIEAAFSVINLSSNLKVASYWPDSVNLLVSGALEVINNIEGDDIVVEIDVAGKGAGTYNIEIVESNIKTTVQIKIHSITPSSISIVLEGK